MNILDGVKNISKIVRQYNDLELNQQIIDLTQQADKRKCQTYSRKRRTQES